VTGKHDQIAGSLIEDILSGHYRVAERLPSERDLAARFDANRGAVREAMKKLEQIGVIEVQPGGARVKEQSEASLDVLTHMLAQGPLPDAKLVDQILGVVDNLIADAAEWCVDLASDEEIEQIRHRIAPLKDTELDQETRTLARIELLQSIMLTSKNLPLRLITRTLLTQVVPSLRAVHPYVNFDKSTYCEQSEQLDAAFANRDKVALRTVFETFSNLNRESMMRAFAAAHDDISQEAVAK